MLLLLLLLLCHADTSKAQLLGTAALIIERKFIHSCGKVICNTPVQLCVISSSRAGLALQLLKCLYSAARVCISGHVINRTAATLCVHVLSACRWAT
jgi:hypothetical protein